MRYNIFIVAGPLHIMNSIEAIDYFKTQNNILLILYTDNQKQLNQMEKILSFIDWYSIKYIPLPQTAIDKIFFAKKISTLLNDIDKDSIDKIFVGEYRSDHVNHIVNFFQNRDIYLLDDGLAQTDYHQGVSSQSFGVKIRRFIYKILFYKLNPIEYTFFTMFDIENEKVVKNSYNFFKRYIENKTIKESVYFIGQPLVEMEILTKDIYKNELSKVINFYGTKEFKYILHRREKEENIKKLSDELNFQYIEFENLIEVEMLNSKVVPSDFATFFSTAIVTLPNFIKESKYRVFEINNRYLNKKFVDEIISSYEEFKKLGIKIESL